MRFWSPFHRYSLDIVSSQPNEIILRAPDRIRLRMSADHLEMNRPSGSCFTHYNHQTCLWECFHSPSTLGHHRLMIWALDLEDDQSWLTAVRFDIDVKDERQTSFIYPLISELFTQLRCQLIEPFNGILRRENLPLNILIGVADLLHLHFQIDHQTIIEGEQIRPNLYRISIPSSIPKNTKRCFVMGLCAEKMYYSTLITYEIE